MSWTLNIKIQENKKVGRLYAGIWVFLAVMSWVTLVLVAFVVFEDTMKGLELLLALLVFPLCIFMLYYPFAIVSLIMLSKLGKLEENTD